MRHGMQGRKFNRKSQHRLAMFSNLSASLIEHEQITTTVEKAKDLRRVIERLVTRAKVNNLANRRLLLTKLGNQEAVDKLLTVIGPRYQARPGGYVRVLRAGFRQGDNAALAVIEFVERDRTAKGRKQREENATEGADAQAV